MIITLISMYFRTLRWHYLLEPVVRAPTHKLFSPVMICFALNSILPGRAGEFARAYLVSRDYKVPFSSTLATVIVERIADGLRKLADVAWEMSAGTGYTVGSRDVEHAAEDQSCTQPQVLLVDYGNPKAVERFMVMSRYLDFWTAVNEAGRRQFKSYMFTTKQIWDEPPFDVDHPYCPLAMVGTGHLVWYTESPAVAEIFLEEAESWARGCLSTAGGKPEGMEFESHRPVAGDSGEGPAGVSSGAIEHGHPVCRARRQVEQNYASRWLRPHQWLPCCRTVGLSHR